MKRRILRIFYIYSGTYFIGTYFIGTFRIFLLTFTTKQIIFLTNLLFRDVFMEKHWKSVISRSVCDYFFDAQNRATAAADVPPVIATPRHYLISVLRSNVFFVAVCASEVPPLFVVEFLHRVVDTFADYFGDCNESVIKVSRRRISLKDQH
jgi:hypothetical protein